MGTQLSGIWSPLSPVIRYHFWYKNVIWSSSIPVHLTLIRVSHCTIGLVKNLVAAIWTYCDLSCNEKEMALELPRAVFWPVITNFTAYYTVCGRRMLSIQPTWRTCTAAIFFWTFGWHSVTSCTNEAKPAWESDISLITFDWALIFVSHKTVVCVEELVFARKTWIECLRL